MGTPEPSTYDERQAAKRERLAAASSKLRAQGEAEADSARTFFAGLQGQPILIGHHSERSDRNRRAKQSAKWDRGHRKQIAADELERRAQSIGNGGVASDDPNAVPQLEAKLARINQERDDIKAVNRIVRKHCPKNMPGPTWPEPRQAIIDDLEAAGYGDYATKAVTIEFTGRVGFASFELSNRTANARRIQQRIDDLNQMNESEAIEGEWEGDNWQMWVDYDAGRIFLEIDGRLTRESFSKIRSQGGFNWSRRDQRYVRKITPNALRAITRLAENLDELIVHE